MAQAGSALGVDISMPAIERARELAEAQGVRNVTFERADAQVHRFPRERSGSLAAPVLLHLATNCAGPLASVLVKPSRG